VTRLTRSPLSYETRSWPRFSRCLSSGRTPCRPSSASGAASSPTSFRVAVLGRQRPSPLLFAALRAPSEPCRALSRDERTAPLRLSIATSTLLSDPRRIDLPRASARPRAARPDHSLHGESAAHRRPPPSVCPLYRFVLSRSHEGERESMTINVLIGRAARAMSRVCSRGQLPAAVVLPFSVSPGPSAAATAPRADFQAGHSPNDDDDSQSHLKDVPVRRGALGPCRGTSL
jgi:hypothetical protein